MRSTFLPENDFYFPISSDAKEFFYCHHLIFPNKSCVLPTPAALKNTVFIE